MQKQSVLPLNIPSVTIHNGRAVTTTEEVACYFGKQHHHVVQRLESLDCSKEFTIRNFSRKVKNKSIGSGAEREVAYYQITKDGFIFLVMGFTGKKAAMFKEAYIAEFNRMEEQLRQKHRPAPPARKYRYHITLHYRDMFTGEEETFRGGCNTTEEIISGTAKRFGYWIDGLTDIPVFCWG